MLKSTIWGDFYPEKQNLASETVYLIYLRSYGSLKTLFRFVKILFLVIIKNKTIRGFERPITSSVDKIQCFWGKILLLWVKVTLSSTFQLNIFFAKAKYKCPKTWLIQRRDSREQKVGVWVKFWQAISPKPLGVEHSFFPLCAICP